MDPPQSYTARAESELFGVQWHKWEPIWNSQLIRKYKEIPVQIYRDTDTKGRWTPQSTLSEHRVISSLFNVVIETQRQMDPPCQHCQNTEWSLHCSMLSLRLKGRWTPQSTLSEHRVISSLFSVVIETKRQMDTPHQHCQNTEWSLHCSMLSLRLKGRWTPLAFQA